MLDSQASTAPTPSGSATAWAAVASSHTGPVQHLPIMDSALQCSHSYRNSYESLAAIIEALQEAQGRDGVILPMLPPLGQELTPDVTEALRQQSRLAFWNVQPQTPLQRLLKNPKAYQQPRPDTSRSIRARKPDGGIAMMFAHLFLQDGDTLVFVDMPANSRLSNSHCDCDGLIPASQVFRVHSEKLLALTNSKFPDLLQSAQHQRRVLKRRNPSPEQMNGINYLLDLTPETEGETAACYISELSLTPGIIQWPSSFVLHNVTSALVTGHDDVCTCQPKTMGSHETKPGLPNHTIAEQDNSSYKPSTITTGKDIIYLRGTRSQNLFETAKHLNIPDYSPVRHANAIIRLMLMIEGKDVPLNSAARVWTMAGVSRLFGCPEVLRQPILAWILGNPTFIEVLPEEALMLAFTFELSHVARLAFRILVNEAAVEALGDKSAEGPPSKLTVFGRVKGQIGDELSNIVQHATLAFMERLTASFEWFEKGQTLINWCPPPIRILEYIESVIVRDYDGDEGVLRQIEDLRLAITRALAVVMSFHGCKKMDSATLAALDMMDMGRATYVESGDDRDDDGRKKPASFVALRTILADFTPKQHLACPFVYDDFRRRFADWAEYPNDFITSRAQALEKSLQELRTAYSPPRSDFPAFDLKGLYAEVRDRAQTWAWFETHGPGAEDLTPLVTHHMHLTLTRHEMKYLPLWAGGDNDGTGGVFVSALPVAELGPNGPGPAYHTGLSEAPSISEEVAEEISKMKLRASTIVGSVDAQDSVSTVYGRDHVIAAGSSIASESFEDDESEIRAAVLQSLRDLQPVDESADMAMEAMEAMSSSSEADSASNDSSTDDFEWFDDAYSDASDDTVMGI